MNIIFANAFYDPRSSTGGNAHIYQFIRNVVSLGHTVCTYAPDKHPDAIRLPKERISRLRMLRQSDVYYVRLQSSFNSFSKWALPPKRWLLGNKKPIVWEFNTIPSADQKTITSFQHYGQGVNLACCVSETIAEYVNDKIGIENVITVPNASDPGLFRPNIPPVQRVLSKPDIMNVVWMGSLNIEYSNWYDFDLIKDAAMFLWDSEYQNKIHFHLLGPGRGMMSTMPLNVHYQGAEDYQKLPQWLSGMDVGLIMYKQNCDGHYVSPLKLFDYMASGLAVVSTPTQQVERILNELHQTESVIPYGEYKKLVDQLIRLYENPIKRKTYGLNGRKLVEEKYNWRECTRRILAAVEDILAQ